jgi:hypothetical protein
MLVRQIHGALVSMAASSFILMSQGTRPNHSIV